MIYGPTADTNLKSLMYTVNVLLSHQNNTKNNNEIQNNSNSQENQQSNPNANPNPNPNPSNTKCSTKPTFYFSFTRRGGISIEDLLNAAKEVGLDAIIMEDFTFDIFNNNVETDSMMWTDTIIAFNRKLVVE